MSARGRVLDRIAIREIGHIEQYALGPQGHFVEGNITQHEGDLPLPMEGENPGQIERPEPGVPVRRAPPGVFRQLRAVGRRDVFAGELSRLPFLDNLQPRNVWVLVGEDRMGESRIGGRACGQRRGSRKAFAEGVVEFAQDDLVTGEKGGFVEFEFGEPSGTGRDLLFVENFLDLGLRDAVQQEPDEALCASAVAKQPVAKPFEIGATVEGLEKDDL